jgi:hypothetical protein
LLPSFFVFFLLFLLLFFLFYFLAMLVIEFQAQVLLKFKNISILKIRWNSEGPVQPALIPKMPAVNSSDVISAAH